VVYVLSRARLNEEGDQAAFRIADIDWRLSETMIPSSVASDIMISFVHYKASVEFHSVLESPSAVHRLSLSTKTKG
jgi:hypothetical protein